jgi:hypothetical protein
MSDTEGDTTIMDEDAVHEEKIMYRNETMTQQELNEKFPNRPHNHSKTSISPCSIRCRTTKRNQASPLSTNAKQATRKRQPTRSAGQSSNASLLAGVTMSAMTSSPPSGS